MDGMGAYTSLSFLEYWTPAEIMMRYERGGDAELVENILTIDELLKMWVDDSEIDTIELGKNH